MKNTTALPLVALLAMAAAPSFAQTAATPEYTFTGNAGLFTDYRFRGISQTDKQPAFQGGFDFTTSRASISATGTPTSTPASTTAPTWRWTSTAASRAASTPSPTTSARCTTTTRAAGIAGTNKIDNTELYVAGGWGPFSLKYSYAVSDFFGITDTKGAYYVDGTITYPLSKEIALIGHVGYQGGLKNGARITEFDGSVRTSITDWKFGATYDLSGWILGASYIDTDRSFSGGTGSLENKDIANGTVVLSVTKSF